MSERDVKRWSAESIYGMLCDGGISMNRELVLASDYAALERDRDNWKAKYLKSERECERLRNDYNEQSEYLDAVTDHRNEIANEFAQLRERLERAEADASLWHTHLRKTLERGKTLGTSKKGLRVPVEGDSDEEIKSKFDDAREGRSDG